MTSYILSGNSALHGSVQVQGSPMAAMAAMALAMLSKDKVTFANVPHLHDLDRMLDELRSLGVAADWTHDHEVTVYAASMRQAPRISSNSLIGWSPLMLAALVIRCELVRLEVGKLAMLDERTKFLIDTLTQFGGRSEWHSEVLHLNLGHQHGAKITLAANQVEETLVTLLLAATAEGESQIIGAAEDPEVEDLLDCLGSMGVYIHRDETGVLTVHGLTELHGTTHVLVADRYEAAFFGLAAVLSGGDVLVQGVGSAEMMSFLVKLQQLGVSYQVGRDGIRFWAEPRQAFQPMQLQVAPYPGLNQSWLSLLMPVLCRAEGESSITGVDSHYVSPTLQLLRSVGAEVHLQHDTIKFFGPVKLVGASFQAADFTSGLVGLLIAVAAGNGSAVNNIDDVDGRFEELDVRLKQLGARIERRD